MNANAGGRTPLYEAAGQSARELVKLLLDSGADPKIPTVDGYTPLHEGVREPEIAKLLVAHGADVNAKGYFGDTPLHYAVNHRSVAVVRLLVDSGADVNARNQQGQTPLARIPRPKAGPNVPPTPAEIEKILVEHGAR